MLTKLRNLLISTALLATATTASANLIVNGSFEDNTVSNGNWSWFNSSVVNGWEGSNIEIWHNLNGISAVDGVQIAELNADGPNSGAWSIFQDFSTVIGQVYDVSFSYRARTGSTTASSEAFIFSVGSLLKTVDDHTTAGWSLFQSSFTATSAVTQLRFTSLNSGTYGNLLDNVVVNAKKSVPESNPLALFAIGALGLLLIRKHRTV